MKYEIDECHILLILDSIDVSTIQWIAQLASVKSTESNIFAHALKVNTTEIIWNPYAINIIGLYPVSLIMAISMFWSHI